MKRFASLLSFAVAAAVAGCDMAQQAALTSDSAPVLVQGGAPALAPLPPLTGASPGYPLNNPLSGYGLGLPPIDPMAAVTGIEIQLAPAASATPQAGAVPEPEPMQAATEPQAGAGGGEPVVRIVNPEIEAVSQEPVVEQAAPQIVYAPVYVPQYVPQYIPQTVIVQTPPLIIVQQEFIPYPVYEPFFIIKHRDVIGWGIEDCDPRPRPQLPAVIHTRGGNDSIADRADRGGRGGGRYPVPVADPIVPVASPALRTALRNAPASQSGIAVIKPLGQQSAARPALERTVAALNQRPTEAARISQRPETATIQVRQPNTPPAAGAPLMVQKALPAPQGVKEKSVLEKPVVVERPVRIEKPVAIEKPAVIEKPIVAAVPAPKVPEMPRLTQRPIVITATPKPEAPTRLAAKPSISSSSVVTRSGSTPVIHTPVPVVMPEPRPAAVRSAGPVIRSAPAIAPAAAPRPAGQPGSNFPAKSPTVNRVGRKP